jgi:FkbM family methyltransferase
MLKQSRFYLRLKASPLYDAYWGVRNSQFISNREKEVGFYRELLRDLPPNALIFDIGANVGDKTDVFLRIGARVVAVEPDPSNQQILRGKFLSLRIKPKPVFVVGKAVSESVGKETMWVDEPGSALNTLSTKWVDALHHDGERDPERAKEFHFSEKRTVETTSLDDLIAKYGCPGFIKIDVEGYEMSVLRGLHQLVPWLSFEVNLPEFRDEGFECLRILRALSPSGEFNFTADCRRGLALSEWTDCDGFKQIFERCTERCIEVFWRNLPQDPRTMT